MLFNKEELFKGHNYTGEEKGSFESFNIEKVTYKKERDLLILRLSNKNILPYNLYRDLRDYLDSLEIGDYKCIFKVEDDSLSLEDFNSYLRDYAKESTLFKEAVSHEDDEGFILTYLNKDAINDDLAALDDLKLYLHDIGYRREVKLSLKEEKKIEVTELPPLEVKKDTRPQNQGNFNNGENRNGFYRKPKNYVEVKIDDMVDNLTGVKFTGEIFKVEEKDTRTGIKIQTIYVKDETNAVIVKCIENRKFTKEVLKQNKEGKTAVFYGNYRYDSYTNDYLFEPDQIEFIEPVNTMTDNEEEKRVELHAHSKYSEMDGVSSPAELITAAYSMGHRAIALTDHYCVQGYHEAQDAYKKIMKIAKEKGNTDFKVLYGCEMNMVEPNLNIVYNPTDELLSEQEYVVFDLETTGLSTRHDYIIEFGAVLMYKGDIRAVKDFFIKPPISLPEVIKKKTHISENDLRNARTFAECKDEILNFIKGRVLVAHNASFDFGFLNEELKRAGDAPLENSVIDTLDLSRSIFKTRRAFRLGNMARAYNVAYDEETAHRANYDADVLAKLFNLMLKDCAKSGVTTLRQLAEFQGEDAFVKNRAFHVNVIARSNNGLHDLYKLVSISNTKTLAVFGKANAKAVESDFIAEPRIFKETLNSYRKDLLIGSACFNGELFEIASTRSREELAKVISFYDFIEIQPLGHYSYLYEDRELFTKERLKTYIKDIIEEAKAQNKIIVATGDVHYVKEDEKILRDVYISAQAIGGAHHPLYVYDKEKRAAQVTPDQRLYNTREMLNAFAWLEDEKLIKELVITNTNKIADMCEIVSPFVGGLKPPKILDAIKKARDCNIIEEPFTDSDEIISADEYLRRLVWHTAKKQYGDNLPELIEKRVEKELDSIIGNGYGVIYFVCHLMVKRSNNDGYIVGSRGSVGSSLVATFSGITEVNPLPPHYICPHCHRVEWREDVASGYDLPFKKCPVCGNGLKGEGQNIPFETFLGFHGDKTPDIDLNFSGDYQAKAHLFTREIFGGENVFRAGTISKVQEKTAFGYVSGYCEEKGITNMSKAQRERLAMGCTDVKRTTGQHPGGIVVLPDDMVIEDVTPIQYPANDLSASWRSTHFEYHDFEENLLKFDILGHVDPTAMKLFEEISGIDVKTIPMNDPEVLSLFHSSKALKISNPSYNEKTGAAGLPEFGTLNTRGMIEETKPHVFSELVQISGLGHGTDVWRGNAQELIRKGIKLSEVIGCRDDIMGTMMSYKLEPKDAFSIMEKVRKGKGLTPEEEALMLEHNVPKWYIESCKKIKYMFPKAHAVAYCIMAVRVAWFKVYHPEYYYVSYFSLRCEAFEIETMIKDADGIYMRMKELLARMNSRDNPLSKKERDIFDTLEVCYEMASRGYRLLNIDLNRSLATKFLVNPDNNKEIFPPFKILDGLGDNVAESIVEARKERPFLSKEDLLSRTLLSQTLFKKLEELGVLNGLDETNQVSLF